MILGSKIFLARFIDLEETRFHWKQKRKKRKNGGRGGGGGGWGEIAVNPTCRKVICFSHFFYAFLCLCCLQTRVRVLFFVCVGSWSFRVRIALCLSCWIHDFVRKVMTSFEIFSQSVGPVGKPNQPVHWVMFVGTTVLVL